MATGEAKPRLRIHDSGRDDQAWPPRADPRRQPLGTTPWSRYGRLTFGAAPGCYVEFSIHPGRPPADVDARYDPLSGKWISIRCRDPLDDAV